jgi:hypothetical protein
MLGRQRFLHFDHQIRFFKHRRMLFHHRHTRLHIVGIGVAGACAGVRFHKYLVASFDELVSRRRQQRDAVFLLFNFFGYADIHRWFAWLG